MASVLFFFTLSSLLPPSFATLERRWLDDGAVTEQFERLQNLVVKQDRVIQELTVRLDKFETLGQRLEGENRELKHELIKLKNFLGLRTGEHSADNSYDPFENNEKMTSDMKSFLPPNARVSGIKPWLQMQPWFNSKNTRLEKTSSDAEQASTIHLSPRADDPSPLDSVVAQIDQQLTTVNAEIQALKTANAVQDQAIHEAGSSTYVHWGSSTCAGNSQLVYAGVAGGSDYRDSGGAVNYLCLSMSPIFGSHSEPQHGLAHLYGAEYRSSDTHSQKDVVCAVCRAPRATTIMIPGTTACQAGWTKEYSGFLMAGGSGHAAASEFVCVDPVLQTRPGGEANNAGKLFYLTYTVCGSLPCDPYQNHKLVTCAVCSK